MKRWISAGLFLIVTSLSGFGIAGEALDRVSGHVEALIPTAPGERDSLNISESLFDYETIGRECLPDRYQDLDYDQRRSYHKALVRLIQHSLWQTIQPLKNHTLNYDSESYDPYLEYATFGQKRKSPMALINLLVERGGATKFYLMFVTLKVRGKWKVVDMGVEGYSMVRVWRALFSKVIAEEGFDELVWKMENNFMAVDRKRVERKRRAEMGIR